LKLDRVLIHTIELSLPHDNLDVDAVAGTCCPLHMLSLFLFHDNHTTTEVIRALLNVFVQYIFAVYFSAVVKRM